MNTQRTIDEVLAEAKAEEVTQTFLSKLQYTDNEWDQQVKYQYHLLADRIGEMDWDWYYDKRMITVELTLDQLKLITKDMETA